MSVADRTRSRSSLWAEVRSAGVVALGLLLINASFVHRRDWNTASRLLLTYAIVDHHRLEITTYVSTGGRLLEHPQTRDLAATGDGRYFCDKAPGHSLLGIAPYAVGRALGLVQPHPVAASVIPFWPADYLTTVLTSGLSVAITSAALYCWIRRTLNRAGPALAVALAYNLSTIALPYATLYYGHVSAGLFALLAVILLERSFADVGDRSTTRSHSSPTKPAQAESMERSERPWIASVPWALLAGLCAGFSVVIEYPLVVVPFILATSALCCSVFERPRKHLLRVAVPFVLGGVPMAILLGAYHHRVTGAFWRFPYTLEYHQELFGYHKEGWGIPIRWPDPIIAYELLFGARRGLFVYCPVLLGVLPGLFLMLTQRRTRLALTIIAISGGLLWINAGYPTWHGGWSTGPRFLLPAIPLLFIPIGYWLAFKPTHPVARILNGAAKSVWGILAMASFLIMVAFTVAGGRIDDSIEQPLSQYLIPTLTRGQVEGHLGAWVASEAGVGPKTGLTNWPGFLLVVLWIVAIVLAIIALARSDSRFHRGGSVVRSLPSDTPPR